MTRAISLSKFLKWSHRITLFVNENELKLSKQPCFVARLKNAFSNELYFTYHAPMIL